MKRRDLVAAARAARANDQGRREDKPAEQPRTAAGAAKLPDRLRIQG
jgi:hypothetical protein